MINRFFTFFLSILFIDTITPHKTNAITTDLPDCVVITHCVREDFKVKDLENAFKKATKIELVHRLLILNAKKNSIVDLDRKHKEWGNELAS